MMQHDNHIINAITHVLTTIIIPKWRGKTPMDSFDKTPGELVTQADIASQHALESILKDLIPDAVFLGEETPNAHLINMSADKLWIVDPLDGTALFAAHHFGFGCNISYCEKGHVHGGWMGFTHTPSADIIMLSASQEQPACINSQPVRPNLSRKNHDIKGVVGLKYFDDTRRQIITDNVNQFCTHTPPKSVPFNMWELHNGDVDFLLYNRILPWDFSAPILWAESVGYYPRHLDGSAVTSYDITNPYRGLLITRSRDEWNNVRAKLNI